MTIFDVISLAGGMALFLYGMSIMGTGLEKIRRRQDGEHPAEADFVHLRAVALGCRHHRLIQSVCGYHRHCDRSGQLRASCSCPRRIGIIMGANIGTTVTGQIIRLSESRAAACWMELLKPDTFAPILAFVGAILFVFIKAPRKRNIGQILMGFGLLFTGMGMMTDSVEPLRESPLFVQPVHHAAESHSGRSGGHAGHHCDSELLGVGGHFAGAFQHRRGHLGQRHPHHFGAEHRHLLHTADRVHRRIQGGQAQRRGTPLFQHHRYAWSLWRPSTA